MSTLSIKQIVGLFVITTSVSACLSAQEIERREKEDALIAYNKANTPVIDFNSVVETIGGCQRCGCAIIVHNNGERIKAYMMTPVIGDKVLCRNGVARAKYEKEYAERAKHDAYWLYDEYNKLVCVDIQ